MGKFTHTLHALAHHPVVRKHAERVGHRVIRKVGAKLRNSKHVRKARRATRSARRQYRRGTRAYKITKEVAEDVGLAALVAVGAGYLDAPAVGARAGAWATRYAPRTARFAKRAYRVGRANYKFYKRGGGIAALDGLTTSNFDAVGGHNFF